MSDNRHLLSIHLVSVDKVSKETKITVDEVERFVKDEIWIVSEISVEGVVLKMRRVEMFSSVLIASVFTDHSLEIVKSEEIRVVPAWGLEGN